jgi:hypothetical protein
MFKTAETKHCVRGAVQRGKYLGSIYIGAHLLSYVGPYLSS